MNWEIIIEFLIAFVIVTSVYCIFKLIDTFIFLVANIKHKPEPNRRFKNVDEIFMLTKAANEFGFVLYDKTKPMEKNELKNRFRNKVKTAHPDHGGNVEDFVRIKKAYDALLPHTTC